NRLLRELRSQPRVMSSDAANPMSAQKHSPLPVAAAANGMRIALAHDWFPSYRGGERVVSSMLDVFPDADIFTLFDFLTDAEKAAFFKSKQFTVSPMNGWPFAKT